MTFKLASKYFLILGKIVCTIALLIVIFVWTLFLIMIIPMIMFLVYHNRKQNISSFKFSMAMVPVGIVGLLLWRLWTTPFERSNHVNKVIESGMRKIKW